MAQNLSNLPIGAKVKYGKHSVNGEPAQDIIWLIVAKNHQSEPAYPDNSVTLFTENIIDIRCFDQREGVYEDHRSERGNNRYTLSNLDQWLNKDGEAGAWFVPTRSGDYPPSKSVDGSYLYAPYDVRPAFLNTFSTNEKNALLPTTIRTIKCTYDGGGYEDVSRKVFLPSRSELTGATGEGNRWEYFKTNSRECAITQQCRNHSLLPSPGSIAGYWLRSCITDTTYECYLINVGEASGGTSVAINEHGVRPAINIPATLTVSDTTDAEGCYTMVWNNAPSYPTSLNIPTTVYGGRNNTISWSSATDPDEDAVTYALECAYNGGEFSQVYSGTSLSCNHFVTYGEASIQYRVKAVDSRGASSQYTTSAVKEIVNNRPPVISGSDTNLGVKTEGFTQTYSITDADGDSVTVVERIDGVEIRSYIATLGETNTFSVTGNTWLAQTNGTHTMMIVASDSFGNSTVRAYTFTKTVNSFTVENSFPMSADTMPTRIAISVNRNIPVEADFKVEVCNNGFDESPAWEDVTHSVVNNTVYLFTNTSKTSSSWGVSVRVTVHRNGAEGACYITAIGGNFE